MTDDDLNILHSIPTELLMYIFTFLSVKELIFSRAVCSRWQQIIDRLTKSELFWKHHCLKDFSDMHKIARYKCKPSLTWHHLYRSFSLWPKLTHAKELRDEFASATHSQDEIQDFHILRNGVIGVHTRGAVAYYDLNTLQPSQRGKITGSYLKYQENDNYIIILSYNLHLFVIRKLITGTNDESSITFDNVKAFILGDPILYYVTLSDQLYMCKLDNLIVTRSLLHVMSSSVMGLGFNNNLLHILTFERNVYSVANKQVSCVYNLNESTNLLHDLARYHFIENIDWRVYYQWMFVLNHTVPPGPLRDVIVIRIYGPLVFIGSNWGVLRIYHGAFSSGQIDLFNTEPIKQYNFMERHDCPVLSTCPILQIDVVEGEDGHTLFVGMPKKIATLSFIHSTKRNATVAMLPYSEVQGVKILKISE